MENTTPTPSDTFIEMNMKEFDEWYDERDDGLYQANKSEIKSFLKSSLQEQDQMWREKIDKALNEIIKSDQLKD